MGRRYGKWSTCASNLGSISSVTVRFPYLIGKGRSKIYLNHGAWSFNLGPLLLQTAEYTQGWERLGRTKAFSSDFFVAGSKSGSIFRNGSKR